MLPPPDEALATLGAMIRAARIARGLTQQRTAKEAGVSRAQLALLEKGRNVSVAFLIKVARFLALEEIALDGNMKLVAGGDGINTIAVFGLIDEIAKKLDELKLLAVDSVLPASEREPLENTAAFKAFVKRHAHDATGLARLTEALVRLSDETTETKVPAIKTSDVPRARARKRSGSR